MPLAPDRQHVTRALYGGWRLARGDAQGMRWFAVDADGFWGSFFAAALVLPLHLAVVLILAEPDVLGAGTLGVEAVLYTASWVDFPIVAIFLTRFLGLTRGYVPMIVATNWISVWQSLLMAPIQIVAGLGLLGGFGDVLMLTGLVAVLVYQWFVTRLALGCPPGTAAAFVVVDLILGVVWAVLTEGMG